MKCDDYLYYFRVASRLSEIKPIYDPNRNCDGYTGFATDTNPARQHQEIAQQDEISATGPRTADGKARSAMRGYKGATRTVMREFAKLLRAQAKALKIISDPR